MKTCPENVFHGSDVDHYRKFWWNGHVGNVHYVHSFRCFRFLFSTLHFFICSQLIGWRQADVKFALMFGNFHGNGSAHGTDTSLQGANAGFTGVAFNCTYRQTDKQTDKNTYTVTNTQTLILTQNKRHVHIIMTIIITMMTFVKCDRQRYRGTKTYVLMYSNASDVTTICHYIDIFIISSTEQACNRLFCASVCECVSRISQQESCATAKMTVQCALYTGARKIFGTP